MCVSRSLSPCSRRSSSFSRVPTSSSRTSARSSIFVMRARCSWTSRWTSERSAVTSSRAAIPASRLIVSASRFASVSSCSRSLWAAPSREAPTRRRARTAAAAATTSPMRSAATMSMRAPGWGRLARSKPSGAYPPPLPAGRLFRIGRRPQGPPRARLLPRRQRACGAPLSSAMSGCWLVRSLSEIRKMRLEQAKSFE